MSHFPRSAQAGPGTYAYEEFGTPSPTTTPAHRSSAPAATPLAGGPAQSSSVDDLVRIFNTALVATRVSEVSDFSKELYSLVESPGFRAILNAVRQFSRLEGIAERDAAEQIIQTFRKVDRLWGDYVFQEGVDRIRNPFT